MITREMGLCDTSAVSLEHALARTLDVGCVVLCISQRHCTLKKERTERVVINCKGITVYYTFIFMRSYRK